jgi:hypothetical protein
MPPVPQICTFSGSSYDSIALRIALPRLKQRRPDGSVLHDVDRERNHRARPGLRRTAQQVQRHGQAVVDVHLVDDRQVEVVLDHRLRDVRGELRMADHLGHRPRAPALVGRLVACRGADREGRDHVEAERRRVVVVDQEDHVGPVRLHPLLRELVALEERLPVGSSVLPRSIAAPIAGTCEV